jgi:rubredoxin
MANCEWQKLPDNLYRCKHCRLVVEEKIEQYCQFASKPYLTHGKASKGPFYLSYYAREDGVNKFKCDSCGATYEDKEVEAVLHDCSVKQQYLEYYEKTKGGKFKFLCPTCGFKYTDRYNKRISHICSNYICEWEPLEDKFKCKNCGIVLDTDDVRLCQEKIGVQGLGDLVAKGLKLLGKQQTKDCGCGDKQNKLNKIVPFK